MKLLAPADFELTWGDVALSIRKERGFEQQVRKLMGLFHLPEQVAKAWVEEVGKR